MKCVIPSQNVKIFGRGIQSLAKIGDELYIEPSGSDLVFCSVSVSQSALCEFKMCCNFFSSYLYSDEDADTKCKVAMKSCLNVFKSPHTFEKQIESCEMRLKPGGNVVIFFMKFTNSSTRKYFLPIIDSEKVEVSYEKNIPNKFIFPSRLLASAIKNFRTSEDEITVKVTEDRMAIKNHLESRRDKSTMRTEVTFEPTEFDCYQAPKSTGVTFCLKELRAAIGFAEPASLPITLLISSPGQPVVVQVSNQPAYEINYVIATLRPSLMELETSTRVTVGTSSPATSIGRSSTARVPSSANPSDEVSSRGNMPSTPSAVVTETPCENESPAFISQRDCMTVENNVEPNTNQVVTTGEETELIDKYHEVPPLIRKVFSRCFPRPLSFYLESPIVYVDQSDSE